MKNKFADEHAARQMALRDDVNKMQRPAVKKEEKPKDPKREPREE